MSAKEIGTVTSGKGKDYDVKWDKGNRDVYVSYAGWTHVGEASSAGDAMDIAEAWLHDK